jgi:hypothetical protein
MSAELKQEGKQEVEWQIWSNKVMFQIDSGDKARLLGSIESTLWEGAAVWSGLIAEMGDFHFSHGLGDSIIVQKKDSDREPKDRAHTFPNLEAAIDFALAGIAEQEAEDDEDEEEEFELV